MNKTTLDSTTTYTFFDGISDISISFVQHKDLKTWVVLNNKCSLIVASQDGLYRTNNYKCLLVFSKIVDAIKDHSKNTMDIFYKAEPKLDSVFLKYISKHLNSNHYRFEEYHGLTVIRFHQ